MKPFPPRFFLNFFRWYCHPDLVNHIEGDLIEVYRRRRKMSRRTADLRFILDVLFLFRPGIIRPREPSSPVNRFGMYKNYLLITLRVFNREKAYGLINLFGLALGFSCCLLIYLFIADELSYDNFHADKERLYRVAAAYMRQGVWEPYATNSWRTAELIKSNYPEVEELVRVADISEIFEYGDKQIVEDHVGLVEENFFRVFNFPLVAGNPADVLKGTNRAVISESAAAKFFGSENPLGKVFRCGDGTYELTVTGVMKDMPSNTHFHFDIIVSNETFHVIASENMFTNVGWDSQHVYVKLAEGTDIHQLEASFPAFCNKNLEFFNEKNFKLFLQAVPRIHLESNIGLEFEDNGSMYRVYTFSAIAVFILLIACINYMNLTTARSLRRSKEVGMRKVLGAKRGELLHQFLTESMVMTGIAVILGFILAILILPDFNLFAGKQIPRSILWTPRILGAVAAVGVVTALVSGFYPAFVLSSFRPQNNMKEKTGRMQSGFILRKGLVVLQFVLSIGLMAASAIVFQQWNFMKNKSLGINKDMVVVVPLETMDRRFVNSFRNELLGNAAILSVGFSNMQMPGWIGNSTSYRAQDVDPDEEVNKSMKIIRIDYTFFQTIEGTILEGRNFSNAYPADSLSSILINQSAMAQLKWTDGVGKWIQLGDTKYNVIGIVKDFHFESVHREIPPTIFIPARTRYNYAYLRITPADIPATVQHIKTSWSKFVTNRDFSYTFMSDDVEHQYRGEQKFTEVFSLFTVLAIIIACLGTFGLISFTAERKSKEIGIRKVLGASVGNVSFMLIREFLILLLIASAFAWPLTWYFLRGWINGFVYHTAIGVAPFLFATLLGVIVVIMTTGFRALKAALSNPVDALRME